MIPDKPSILIAIPIEAAFTLQHLIHEKILSSIGFSKKDDTLKKKPPVVKSKKRSYPAAIFESVAFGGKNSILIFSNI